MTEKEITAILKDLTNEEYNLLSKDAQETEKATKSTRHDHFWTNTHWKTTNAESNTIN